MKIKKIAKITGGQDGAIYNKFLFRFAEDGEAFVYDLRELYDNCTEVHELTAVSSFYLDRRNILNPHSNSVSFGNQFYCQGDEFPLLYTNVYNNYADKKKTLPGVCCVYRIQRENNIFSSTLVQVLEIGFVDNEFYWKSPGGDVRPYGNFVADAENSRLHVFTMRDASHTTEYFSFELPDCFCGNDNEVYGVKHLILDINDIKEHFSCEYHHYIQGACFYKRMIYSLEGFSDDESNQPVLRIIDVETKKQKFYKNLRELGLNEEPEFIDFDDDVCYYADNPGDLYVIDF